MIIIIINTISGLCVGLASVVSVCGVCVARGSAMVGVVCGVGVCGVGCVSCCGVRVWFLCTVGVCVCVVVTIVLVFSAELIISSIPAVPKCRNNYFPDSGCTSYSIPMSRWIFAFAAYSKMDFCISVPKKNRHFLSTPASPNEKTIVVPSPQPHVVSRWLCSFINQRPRSTCSSRAHALAHLPFELELFGPLPYTIRSAARCDIGTMSFNGFAASFARSCAMSSASPTPSSSSVDNASATMSSSITSSPSDSSPKWWSISSSFVHGLSLRSRENNFPSSCLAFASVKTFSAISGCATMSRHALSQRECFDSTSALAARTQWQSKGRKERIDKSKVKRSDGSAGNNPTSHLATCLRSNSDCTVCWNGYNNVLAFWLGIDTKMVFLLGWNRCSHVRCWGLRNDAFQRRKTALSRDWHTLVYPGEM